MINILVYSGFDYF